jgi:hypothetical protein
VLDLSYNLVQPEILLQELMPAMKHNKTATNVDLRGNPGYTRRVWKYSSMYLLRNVDFLKKSGISGILHSWINLEILPSKTQRPSGINVSIGDEDDELMVDQENRKNHNRAQSVSKKRQGSKVVKKVSILRPEDIAFKPKVMNARPPKPSGSQWNKGHTRA